ncbi:SAM-dependent methyltransferase [Synergistales bacterium]|nr:SAM-dependent methyltransferase [Synergistales bacterium]
MSLQTFLNLAAEQNSRHAQNIAAASATLTDEENNALKQLFDFLCSYFKYDIRQIVDAYLALVDSLTEQQMNFMRTGKYQNSTFEEVEHYYEDGKIMKNYVIGFAVSLYLWPHHMEVMRFYKKNIREGKGREGKGSYLEIGPGHGHLLVTAMGNSNFDSYTAVDISQTSVDTTASYVKYCLPGSNNYAVLRKNFFDFDSSEKFDALVMGEVLEHVEEPEKFLRKIRELAADDAFIYISTAVNAPQFDHIHHFHSVEEVEDMFTRCGLKVADKIYGIANGVSLDKAVKKKYAIVPAYVLSKI